VNEIQNDTGFTFFTALSPNLATVLRSKVDGQPAPVLYFGFLAFLRRVGQSVSISGTNLNFTTNVAFHGLGLVQHHSPTNVTAIVPSNCEFGVDYGQDAGGDHEQFRQLYRHRFDER